MVIVSSIFTTLGRGSRGECAFCYGRFLACIVGSPTVNCGDVDDAALRCFGDCAFEIYYGGCVDVIINDKSYFGGKIKEIHRALYGSQGLGNV